MKSLETPLDMKKTCFSRNLKMSKPDFNFPTWPVTAAGTLLKSPETPG